MDRDSKKLAYILKKIRLDNNENLKNMADKLEFSSTFLSAIENGKKKVPDDFKNKLYSKYNLNDEYKKDLNEAIIINNNELDLELSSMNVKQKEFAISLGRTFESLDDNELDKLLEIISSKE